jgi:hypothetical protein
MPFVTQKSTRSGSLFLSDGQYVGSPVDTQTPWSESESEVYRPSDRRLSVKLVPTFADGGCQVVSMTDPYGRILGFLDCLWWNYIDITIKILDIIHKRSIRNVGF